MAGWSILTNGSALDRADDVVSRYKGGGGGCFDNNQPVKNEAECIVLDDSDEEDYDCEDKVICLFDEIVSDFLNEAAGGGCIRPIPALLGDGQSLDLFKLFWVVRKRGGFDLVNGFWSFVAKELGLDSRFSASVKLVYVKYLYKLEKYTRSSRVEKLTKEKHRYDGKADSSWLELETQFKSLLSLRYDRVQEDIKFASLECKRNGRYEMDIEKNEIGLLGIKDVHRVHIGVGDRNSDDGENVHGEKRNNCNDSDDDVVILEPNIAKKEFESRKRKRESLTKMLNWVIQIAKCPTDPSIGVIPPKWKDHRGNELWLQAIRARDALLRRRHVDPNIEQPLLQVCNNQQHSQKMHPSMFDEFSVSSDQSAEKSRCSKRLTALVKPHSCSSTPQSRSTNSLKTECENGHKEQQIVVDNLPSKNTALVTFGDEHVRRHVAVGPLFQAEVSEWTGMVSDSDSKWLGTRSWPVEYEDCNALVAMDTIGKGRPSVCCCQLPGSVECVRFHIAENRMKLKLQLGLLFYHWRFDRMGEEVSLRWTFEEEKRFKSMVRFNPHSAALKRRYFPGRTREELASYYFNVYLVQRRSYQNRVTPKNIDSDDDETEFGSLGNGYGHEAIKVPGFSMMICSENKQSTDFE